MYYYIARHKVIEKYICINWIENNDKYVFVMSNLQINFRFKLNDAQETSG